MKTENILDLQNRFLGTVHHARRVQQDYHTRGCFHSHAQIEKNKPPMILPQSPDFGADAAKTPKCRVSWQTPHKSCHVAFSARTRRIACQIGSHIAIVLDAPFRLRNILSLTFLTQKHKIKLCKRP
ncbi:MAG: hypothetical protein ACLQVY_25675 [Limisphaerales bacterium]